MERIAFKIEDGNLLIDHEIDSRGGDTFTEMPLGQVPTENKKSSHPGGVFLSETCMGGRERKVLIFNRLSFQTFSLTSFL